MRFLAKRRQTCHFLPTRPLLHLLVGQQTWLGSRPTTVGQMETLAVIGKSICHLLDVIVRQMSLFGPKRNNAVGVPSIWKLLAHQGQVISRKTDSGFNGVFRWMVVQGKGPRREFMLKSTHFLLFNGC